MDLQELRRKIDEIDSQIVSLYEQRMDISKEVAEYKIETGKRYLIRYGRKKNCAQ